MKREYTWEVQDLLDRWISVTQGTQVAPREELAVDIGLALVERLEALVEVLRPLVELAQAAAGADRKE